MKKKIVIALLSVVLGVFIAGQSFAADAALKVGIVDMYKALNESDQGKKAKADLESLIKSKQATMEDKGKAIEKVKGELEKQGSVLSADARRAKEEELERLTRDYQRNATDAQAEVRKKEGELTGRILGELRASVAGIAQEEGYSLVLERAEGLILYSSESLDITDKVIKRFNEPKPKAGK